MQFSNLKLKEICLVLKNQTRDKAWVAENRRNHIIGVALSGSEFHDLGYQRFTIEENCIFFLNQRDDFAVRADEPGACYSIHFTTYEEIDTDSFCVKLGSSAPFAALFDKQLKLAFENELTAAAHFYQICALFDEIYRQKYAPGDRRMLEAGAYLDQHFVEPRCLAEVYARCDLSRRRFDQLFRRRFSVTPAGYILAKRIAYAENLLSEPKLSVAEVAELCGFHDVYRFCKVFKQQTSMTPGGFRKAGDKLPRKVTRQAPNEQQK